MAFDAWHKDNKLNKYVNIFLAEFLQNRTQNYPYLEINYKFDHSGINKIVLLLKSLCVCLCVSAAGEAKNLGPVWGPNRQKDLCTFCTISLDQEEVFRTKVYDKSLRWVVVASSEQTFSGLLLLV